MGALKPKNNLFRVNNVTHKVTRKTLHLLMRWHWTLKLNDFAKQFNDYLVLVTDSSNFTRFSVRTLARNGERSF